MMDHKIIIAYLFSDACIFRYANTWEGCLDLSKVPIGLKSFVEWFKAQSNEIRGMITTKTGGYGGPLF